MKIKVVPHFDDIFPDEIEQGALDYLIKISKEVLLKSIGFLNTYPLPNYNNFFSNPQTRKEVFIRINWFKKLNNEDYDIEIISPYSYLRLSEIVLGNLDKFTQDGDSNVDQELLLFKAFLTLNSKYREYKHDFSEEKNQDGFVNFLLLQSFQLSELSNFNDDKEQFVKLIYATNYKVKALLDFLSVKGLEKIKKKFIASFDMKSEQELKYEMKFLFAMLFIAKYRNQYIFTNENFKSFSLIKNISTNKIVEDEDFTSLKITPIYFLDENRFSVINFFFAIDLFYRSAKFRLKKIFKEEGINVGDFFSYYNKKFSEEFLMKNLLDNIFEKPFFKKLISQETEQPNEPDYYVNYNNSLLIFENKDVLINKSIKASTNIEPIMEFLMEKFYLNKTKKVGIQQIVYSIEKIHNKDFIYDSTINYKKKIEIFPILLVQDRIFQSAGINYKLNNVFRKELQDRRIFNNEKFKVHALTLIDIDTLILWNINIQNKFQVLKSLLVHHTKSIEEKPKKDYKDVKYFSDYLERTLKPISDRATPFFIPKNHFSEQFIELKNNKS